jgi:hypothetical protein
LGETAKGEQSIANQGQEWMVFAPWSRKLVLQVSKKVGNTRGMANREEMGQWEARDRVDVNYNRVYVP